MLCSDWLNDSTLGCDWLYFSHAKNAIREADWTYHFFTCENIAHIDFYLEGLLPKILRIYTINTVTLLVLVTNRSTVSWRTFC